MYMTMKPVLFTEVCTVIYSQYTYITCICMYSIHVIILSFLHGLEVWIRDWNFSTLYVPIQLTLTYWSLGHRWYYIYIYTHNIIYVLIYVYVLVNVLLKFVPIGVWIMTVSTCIIRTLSMHLNVLELVPMTDTLIVVLIIQSVHL